MALSDTLTPKSLAPATAMAALMASAAIGTPSDTAPCWRWEQMKPRDLDMALMTMPVAYLVVSPVEWHGEAMAFGTDPVIGADVAERAWRRTGGVLIPTLYLGAETNYHDWTRSGLTDYWGLEWNTKQRNPGSLYVSATTLELVLRDMLSFIERDGFRVCVLVTGHGATEHVRVLRDLEQRWKGRPMTVLFSEYKRTPRPADLRFEGSGGHADFAEASHLGGVDPSMVDTSAFGVAAPDRATGVVHENVDRISYEKGERAVAHRAESLAEGVLALVRPTVLKPVPAEQGFHRRICFGSAHMVQDAHGRLWEADRLHGAFSRVDRGDIAIAGTQTPEIYRTEAFGMDSVSVRVPPGTYTLSLHFAETYEGTEKAGQRVFDIAVNGAVVAERLDVFREAGNTRNRAVVRTCRVAAPEGVIRIGFTEGAVLNGLEIAGGEG